MPSFMCRGYALLDAAGLCMYSSEWVHAPLRPANTTLDTSLLCLVAHLYCQWLGAHLYCQWLGASPPAQIKDLLGGVRGSKSGNACVSQGRLSKRVVSTA